MPSLLGLHAVPPYLHNGAAESLAAVVSDLKHRTANGRWSDRLANSLDQSLVVAFLESIDTRTVPFVPLAIQRSGNQVTLSFESIAGVQYGIEARATLSSTPSVIQVVPGNGQRLNVPLTITGANRFFRLTSP